MARHSVDGSVVVITGAGGGLGTALARALRVRGAKLALLDRRPERSAELARELGGPDVAISVAGDVTDLDALHEAMRTVDEHFGRIDVVVANAGVDHLVPFSIMELEDFEQSVDVNLTGVWRTFKAALPHVRRSRGYLLAISSMAAFVHSPTQSQYTAAKAGVWALCDSLRLELRHLGVGVGVVYPTFFHSPMFDALVDDQAGRLLWGGNESLLWRKVAPEKVVRDTVRAIERRSKCVTSPRRLAIAARMPGVARSVVERIGFTGDTVPSAIDAAERSAARRAPEQVIDVRDQVTPR